MARLSTIILVAIISWSVADPLLAADKVTLQLRWDHQFQFAGYYAALWQGYYKDAGLDVEIRSAFEPDGTFHDVIREVAEGRAQFGTGAIDILEARSQGIPLVVVASVFQQSPVAFYAQSNVILDTPADLVGLRLATRGPRGVADAELRAMLRNEDIDPNTVKMQLIKGKLGLFDLKKGVADVVSGFTISADWVAKQLGMKLHRLRPATYGVDFYGSALFTHQRVIDENPELVERFRQASMKGWKYALTHRKEMVEAIATKLTRKIPIDDVRGFNAFQADEIFRLTNYPIVQLGHSNPARWQKMHAALVDLGLANGPFDPASLFFDLDTIKRRAKERLVTLALGILGTVVFLTLAGWLVSLVVVARKRRQVERALLETKLQLDSAIDSFVDGFALFDANDRLVFVNDALRKSHPSASEALVVGSRIDDIVKTLTENGFYGNASDEPDDLPQGRIGRHRSGEAFDYRAENGRWFELKEYITRDDGVAIVRTDVTERKRAKDDLERALVDAEHANRAKTEFLATMSHEFRTPLNAIMGFSEMLRSQYFGPLGADNYKEYADDIHHSGQQMLSLVNDILDISAIEAGKRNFDMESIAVPEIAADCVRRFELAAKEGGIGLTLGVADGVPSISSDHRSVTQIIQNLLSNAIKFTEPNGSISVKVYAVDNEVVISVADTGIGIPAKYLARITEPFTQVNSDPHRARVGSGLGLSIVKSIIEAHGGRLSIFSEPGRGTTAAVSFPCGHSLS